MLKTEALCARLGSTKECAGGRAMEAVGMHGCRGCQGRAGWDERDTKDESHARDDRVARTVRKCTFMQFSSSLSVIIVQQSTQPLSAFESARTRKGSEFRPDDLVLQPLMVSFSVVMGQELRGRPMEAGCPDQNHAV